MKRMKVLFGNRRMMVLLTLAILVLAAAALIASSASFTATSANIGNMFTAGTLELSNDSTLLPVSNIMPDDVWHPVGSVTVGNTGGKVGALTMTTSEPAGSSGRRRRSVRGPPDPHHPGVRTGFVIYTGDIERCGRTGHGQRHAPRGTPGRTRSRSLFPNGDGAGPAGADNAYRLSSTEIDFDWEIVNL